MKANGSFTPDAQLIVTPTLRASGVLRELQDSDTRSLLALLTFLTPNGRIEANAGQVASALGVSESKALARLRRLCLMTWQGRPIVSERFHDSVVDGQPGLSSFVPARHVVGSVLGDETEESDPAYFAASQSAPVSLAGREAVIAHSRASYARPRAEVERDIAAQYGAIGAVDFEAGAGQDTTVRGRLLALGVMPDQVQFLLANHTEQEISDQFDWLPMRGAKNPARFIVAAIQHRYEPPPRVRLERAIAAEEAEVKEQSMATVAQPPSELSVGETALLPLPETSVAEPRDESSPE